MTVAIYFCRFNLASFSLSLLLTGWLAGWLLSCASSALVSTNKRAARLTSSKVFSTSRLLCADLQTTKLPPLPARESCRGRAATAAAAFVFNFPSALSVAPTFASFTSAPLIFCVRTRAHADQFNLTLRWLPKSSQVGEPLCQSDKAATLTSSSMLRRSLKPSQVRRHRGGRGFGRWAGYHRANHSSLTRFMS